MSWIEPQFEPQFDISKCFHCLQTSFSKQIRSYQSRPGLPCGAMDWDPIYDGALKRPQYGERQTNSGGVRPKQRFNWKQRLIAFAHILEPGLLSFLNDVNLRQFGQRRELSIHLSHSRLLSTLSSNMLSLFFFHQSQHLFGIIFKFSSNMRCSFLKFLETQFCP